MNTKELELLIQKVLKEMEVKGYKKQTISSERNTFNQLIKYCIDKEVDNYNMQIGMQFLEEHYHLSEHNNATRYKCRRLRTIYLLEWYSKGVDITKKSIPRIHKYSIPESYLEMIKEYEYYLLSNGYSSRSINYKVYTLNILFNFAIKKGIYNYEEISKELIYEFIDNINNDYCNSSLYAIKYHIKNFYDYLFESKKSTISGKSIFPRIIKKDREKLPSYYTKEEIKKIISLVDTTKKIGKRDYAVLMLAITYGLRNSDIVNLTFKNIDWNHNKIIITQYKTKEKLELSLTEQVKLSLLDYIKNARPNIQSDYIFLNFKFPYEYHQNKSLYKSLEKYILVSDIEIKDRKKGLHSLRHSCATNMLSNNVQLPVITGILGHSSIETTNIYLSVSIEQLKKISLEVPNCE